MMVKTVNLLVGLMTIATVGSMAMILGAVCLVVARHVFVVGSLSFYYLATHL